MHAKVTMTKADKVDSTCFPPVDRKTRGRCPTCKLKRGFRLVKAVDMANESMSVVEHVDDLLENSMNLCAKSKHNFREQDGALKDGRRNTDSIEPNNQC